ncbi:hypothetical protein I7V30_09730 [Lelliottia amnigena]|uniref:hypothetical protein n=1 Tax=Lelliottia amnigena TaxID=61646 RepID=UPI00192C4469|nr:hypothetical protein [Lelliottia amnigena]MBL5965541.1 hypothetical protein [Lelliottia amnigena]
MVKSKKGMIKKCRKIMKLMENRVCWYVCLLTIFSSSLLAQDEYFSCNTSKGVATLTIKNNQLIYRTEGDKGKFEFSSNAPTYDKFLYNHYSRFQTDYLTISFINSSYEYSIFSSYENNKEEKGVSVLNVKSKKEYKYDCIKTKTDNLIALTEKLQCNKDSALGC